jgi:YfiH family protein
VAACHAGWRGVAGGILGRAIELLEAAGSRRSDLLVALGPAVSGANYQVERQVSVQLGDLDQLQAAGALLPDPHPGRDRLDIRAASLLQLQGLGLGSEQLSSCPLCTVAEPELFHSWRRDQVKAVQWSAIVAQG